MVYLEGTVGNLEQAANLNTLTAALVDLPLHLFSVTFCQYHRLSQPDHSQSVHNTATTLPVLLERGVPNSPTLLYIESYVMRSH
jgi:hypothetical protein